MEQQYLVQEPIARIKLSKIEAQSGTLGERNAALEKMLAEAREEIKAIRGQLDSSEGAKNVLFGVSNIDALAKTCSLTNKYPHFKFIIKALAWAEIRGIRIGLFGLADRARKGLPRHINT